MEEAFVVGGWGLGPGVGLEVGVDAGEGGEKGLNIPSSSRGRAEEETGLELGFAVDELGGWREGGVN